MLKICQHCQYDALKGTIVSFSTKDIIFMEGEELSHIYMIIDGYLKMVKYMENGDERIIGVLGPHDYVALLAVLQGKHQYPATAVVINDVRLKKIPKQQVWDTYQRNERFKTTCLHCAVTRSNLFQRHLIQSVNMDTKERILNMLLGLYDKFGRLENHQHLLTLPFSKTVLANLIGIRRETLSRYLSKLQEEEIISIDKNTYVLYYVT